MNCAEQYLEQKPVNTVCLQPIINAFAITTTITMCIANCETELVTHYSSADFVRVSQNQ